MIYTKEGLEIIELGEDDGTVIFDSSTGDTNVLDSIAADVFRCFSEHHKIEDVVSELSRIYNASPDVIHNDVLEFTENLLAQGLLTKREA